MDPCLLAIEYSEMKALVFANAFKVFLALVGCCSFAFVFYYQRLTSIFHQNARIILCFHLTFVFLALAGTLLSEGTDTIRLTIVKWTSTNPNCPIPPMSPYLSIFKLMYMSGTEGSTYTATAWALERLYATIFISSYEKQNAFLGWTLGFMATTGVLFSCAVRILTGDYTRDIPLMFITGSSYPFNMIVIHITAALDFVNVLIFLAIFFINHCRQRKLALIQSTLTYKYQLRENILATSLIFPLNLLHCIAYLPVAVITPIITEQRLVQMERITLYASIDWAPVYYIALPLLLWWRNGVKRNAVESLVRNNLIGAKYASARREGHAETAKYFEMFNQMLA
ncbi:hypothetical protein QR680_010997 [Steinernema hermaphroditum]|uniref:Uncharacterized protein n=1 Tax=Steinernema hermaphroditum TaxID=289476 RepID=A0AA39MC39_9BILA|nr:hypothetical protein QR680_010997 [Steinernema hermaphroditum]